MTWNTTLSMQWCAVYWPKSLPSSGQVARTPNQKEHFQWVDKWNPCYLLEHDRVYWRIAVDNLSYYSPYHDACTAENSKNSSGFFSACNPRNAGITMVGKATARPRSSSNKFLAELAKICRIRKKIVLLSSLMRRTGWFYTCGKIVRNVLISLNSSVDSLVLPSDFSLFESTAKLLLLTLYVAFLETVKFNYVKIVYCRQKVS